MITEEQIENVLCDFGEGDILLLQNEINSIDYIIAAAHKKGMIVILNPSPIDERILTLDYSMIDYLILNEIEAKDVTGAQDYEGALSIFREKHPHMKIMLTLGKRGCIYQDENQRVYHPVFETNAIDTTAAGDTFTGYFVRGISQGIRIEETLKMASCAAAISVSRKGASTSIPLFQEVQENLEILKTKENNTCSEQFLRQLDGYINSNISTATLEGLAKVFGYSKVYTSGLIKKYTSLGYKQYLHKKRLEKAVNLLLNSSLSIAEIIKLCGYENTSYFRKIFKEAYNVNPYEYRKRRVSRND